MTGFIFIILSLSRAAALRPAAGDKDWLCIVYTLTYIWHVSSCGILINIVIRASPTTCAVRLAISFLRCSISQLELISITMRHACLCFQYRAVSFTHPWLHITCAPQILSGIISTIFFMKIPQIDNSIRIRLSIVSLNNYFTKLLLFNRCSLVFSP